MENSFILGVPLLKHIRVCQNERENAKIEVIKIKHHISWILNRMLCVVPHQSPLDQGGNRVVRRCLVNFQCLLIWIIVGQGPIALVVGADGDCLDIFLSSITSLFFLPLSGRRPDID